MLQFYSLFLFISVLVFLSINLKLDKRILYILGFVLIVFAGMRANGVDRDYEGYIKWFDEAPMVMDFFSNTVSVFQRDPGFLLINSIFKSSDFSFELLIFCIAFFSVTLKVYSIQKMSPIPILSFLVYFSYIFLLQEMTTIRAGLAASIFLFSIPFLIKRRTIFYIFLIGLATTLHYSALLFLLFLLMKNENEKPNFYIFLIILSLLMSVLGTTVDFIFVRLAELNIDPRIDYYALEFENGLDKVNIYNTTWMSNLLLSLILLLNFEKMKKISGYASHIIRIHAISVILFFSFSGYPVMAFRLAELVGAIGILAWPFLIFVGKNRLFMLILFLAACLNFFFSTLRIMDDYSISLFGY
ncbi:EpsG family protein [Comamonas testosteroni]|uniref:EpsG family protein n=1 Tax=Comamonas testosteroni TaxID=285 RepID=UPI0006823DFD|nr:EpsG family protein [Comamonas testosteroni]